MGAAKRTGLKEQVQVTCKACGAAIGRHEPLVIVDGGGARRGTLATESKPFGKNDAIYHPGCFSPANAASSPAPGERRVFAEALCGVDGSDAGFAAVEQAASLVGPGGQLTVLVVTSLRTGVGQMLPNSAMEMAERANALADEAGVSCTVEVDPAGPVQEVIRGWAAGHDLLAIGAPPKSGVARMWLSGVTNTALHSLATPLLVARPAGAATGFGERGAATGLGERGAATGFGEPGAATGFGERMLVASDGLKGSDELVALASRIARQGSSALTLIHALRSRSVARRSKVDAQVERIRLEDVAGIDGEPAVIETGSADDAIIGASQRLKVSLIVMSSRGRSGLSALGSVSRRVIHHAGCSVLLVPPHGGPREGSRPDRVRGD